MHWRAFLAAFAFAFVLPACHRKTESDAEPAPSATVDPSAYLAAAMADQAPSAAAAAPSASISAIAASAATATAHADLSALLPGGNVPRDFALTVETTRCFGHCPNYSVTIDAAGRVQMTAQTYTTDPESSSMKGCANQNIGAQGVIGLVRDLNDKGFFAMKEPHVPGATDQPHVRVELTMNGHTRSIDHNLGAHWPAGVQAQLDSIVNPIARMSGATAFLANPTAHPCSAR